MHEASKLILRQIYFRSSERVQISKAILGCATFSSHMTLIHWCICCLPQAWYQATISTVVAFLLEPKESRSQSSISTLFRSLRGCSEAWWYFKMVIEFSRSKVSTINLENPLGNSKICTCKDEITWDWNLLGQNVLWLSWLLYLSLVRLNPHCQIFSDFSTINFF